MGLGKVAQANKYSVERWSSVQSKLKLTLTLTLKMPTEPMVTLLIAPSGKDT